MKPIKIAAIFLIIGAGLIGSYLIVKNPAATSSSGQTLSVSNQDFGKNPLKWIENAAKSVIDSANGLADAGNSLIKNGTGGTETANSVNMTDVAAKAVFNRMQSLDASGNNPFQGKQFDPNDPQNQKLIEETINNVQGSSTLFSPKVENSDLKISSDVSQGAKVEYLKKIQDASQKRLGISEYKRAEEEIIQDFTNDCFSPQTDSVNLRLANSYSDAANDYLGIYVPSDWAGLHKQMITYFKKGNLIYSAMGKCYEDPISGYLAIQELPQFLSESQFIQNSLINEAKEAGL